MTAFEGLPRRLHVFDGLGPNVAGRWPVAMNLVLQKFLESVRAGMIAGWAAVEA